MLSALLIVASTPTPTSVMHAYWDRLGKARSVYAKFTVPNAAENRYEVWECWLERPHLMRMKGPDTAIESNGKSTTFRNAKVGIKHTVAASPDDIPPALDPFFGRHRLNAAGWSTFPPSKRCVMLFSNPSAQLNVHVYLDPSTNLPIGTSTSAAGVTYTGQILILKFDQKVGNHK